MKILRFLFTVLICLSFFTSSFSQAPTLEADWISTPVGPGEAVFESKFKVFGTDDVPVNSIVKVVIVAEIIDTHPLIEIEAWEPVSYYCGNVHIEIVPYFFNPMRAVITATFDSSNQSLGNNLAFRSCSEAEVMLLSGEEACGSYGIDIIDSGTYVRYFDGNKNVNVIPVIVDKIINDPCNPPTHSDNNSARKGNFNETSIYPNPAHDKVTIQSTEESHIQIYNLSGKLIFEKQNARSLETISTEGWSNGVYIVKLLTKEDNKISQYKLSVLN